jgi:hypothetical protein
MDKILIMDNFLNECDLKTLLEIININTLNTAKDLMGDRFPVMIKYFYNIQDSIHGNIKFILEKI